MDLDPSVVRIAVVVLLLQVITFLRTWGFAREMTRLFAFDPIATIAARSSGRDAGAVGTGFLPSPLKLRFEIEEPPGAQRLHRTLIERSNQSLGLPADLDTHFRRCSDIAAEFVDRSDARAAQMANVPVYLGLIGTFAGVIAGLINLSNDFSEPSIQAFLAGVLVAMVTSLVGLGLMVVANAIVVPGARVRRDDRLSSYLGVLRTSLVDAVGEVADADDSPRDLRETLEELSNSLRGFTNSVEPQRQLIRALQGIDLAGLIQTNITMLGAAGSLLTRFEQLDKSITSMTTALDGTQRLVASVTTLMDRIVAFEESMKRLGAKLEIDDIVTRNTIEWIKKQIESLKAPAAVIEQFANEQEFRVKEIVLRHQQEVSKVADAASQRLDVVARQITDGIRESTEPQRVISLFDHAAALPEILAAIRQSAGAGAASQQQLSVAATSLTRAADRMAEAASTFDVNSPSHAIMRWLRRFRRNGRPPDGPQRGLSSKEDAKDAHAR